MSTPVLSFALGRGLAMARAAEAMLRALGGGEVQLRFSIPANGDSQGDARLALASMTSEDVALAPVVVRNAPTTGTNSRTLEMLFAPSSVHNVMEVRGFDSAEALFSAAVAILHNARAYRVANVAAECCAATPYLYRVTVTE